MNAKTSSAAAPCMNPDSSTSGPQVLPRSADTPAATISAKIAAPGLRMISGARIGRHQPDAVHEVLERGAKAKTGSTAA